MIQIYINPLVYLRRRLVATKMANFTANLAILKIRPIFIVAHRLATTIWGLQNGHFACHKIFGKKWNFIWPIYFATCISNPGPYPWSSSMPLNPRRSRVIKHYRVNTAISVLPALVVQGIFYTLVPFVLNRSPPKPMRTSAVSGAEYIHDVMYCGNPRRI